jgi:hypothetical protein
MLAAPMARLQKKTQAAVTTGSADTAGIPRADGFTGLYVISPGTGSFAPVVRNARHEHRDLDTSTGMSGPHDFAVRAQPLVAQAAHVHRIPPQRP